MTRFMLLLALVALLVPSQVQAQEEEGDYYEVVVICENCGGEEVAVSIPSWMYEDINDWWNWLGPQLPNFPPTGGDDPPPPDPDPEDPCDKFTDKILESLEHASQMNQLLGWVEEDWQVVLIIDEKGNQKEYPKGSREYEREVKELREKRQRAKDEASEIYDEAFNSGCMRDVGK